ncbi:hypothetical protein [Hyalangium gracile]|uniref:hypothetical protein n=1 Tax=Hyalangium gracile TaxID=394092 RepID=UPI001CC98FFF|nr:hypothetical protein [Hyalangium gracile]
MSSLLVTSLLLGVACGPNGELEDSSELATLTPEESGEATSPATPDDSAEVPEPAPVDLSDEELPVQEDALGSATPSVDSGTVNPAAVTLRTVAGWEQLFLGRWNTEHNSIYLPMSRSLDSWQFYNLGYGIDANTAMYRATGKTQYLDRALQYVNNVVANARVSSSLGSNFRDSYLGWKTTRAEVVNQEVPLYESYCWRYVTRLLRVIRETPALYANPTYRNQYENLLAFTERNIFEKWYTRGANAYIYRARTHMAAHWAAIAMNLSRMTTDATRRARYTTVVSNINRDMPNNTSSLRQQMRTSTVNPAAYFWSDVWGSTARPGQDVSHGNNLIAYLVEAHEAGIEWTADDMRRFTTTFNSLIWPSAGRYAYYVDGSGNGNGWFNDGLIKLGRYDANVQRRLESHTVGQNIQFYANGALNARILSGQPTP